MATKHKFFLLLSAIFMIVGIIFVIWEYNQWIEAKESFERPSIEMSAQQGVPEVPEDLGYAYIQDESLPYTAHLCGVFSENNGSADLYFTNDDTNDYLMLLKVEGENGKLLGETGLIKPGEYVKSVKLNESPEAGSDIRLRIVAYEPETYYSAGSVVLNTTAS